MMWFKKYNITVGLYKLQIVKSTNVKFFTKTPEENIIAFLKF